MIYKDMYFYTKLPIFETRLSLSFSLVKSHNLELLSFQKNMVYRGFYKKD